MYQAETLLELHQVFRYAVPVHTDYLSVFAHTHNGKIAVRDNKTVAVTHFTEHL